jgi:hypothetical protein
VFNQLLPEGSALSGVRQCLNESLAQQRRATQYAIQSRVRRHLYDGWNTATIFSHQEAVSVLEFDFSAGVASVADFVF